jgi:O-acetyl-ADP-ribose deacetylase (regulator of RNase III)
VSGAEKIVILQGDLTEMDVDAVVNAANNDLQLGGGVAGAIRRKGGSAIQQECDAIGSIPIGSAAITGGGTLKARHVIHAASMQLGGLTTAPALRASTLYSLHLAAERGLRSMAFPAVGTGIAGFPLRDCAEVMLHEAAIHLQGKTSLEKIFFVLFDQLAVKEFRTVWQELLASGELDDAVWPAPKKKSRPAGGKKVSGKTAPDKAKRGKRARANSPTHQRPRPKSKK